MIKIETAGFILGMVIGLTILTVGASRIYQKYDMLTNWKQIDATITKMNVDSYFQSKMIWGDPAYDWTNEFTREYEYILKKKYTGKSETSFSYASDDGVEEAKAFFHEYSNDKEAACIKQNPEAKGLNSYNWLRLCSRNRKCYA